MKIVNIDEQQKKSRKGLAIYILPNLFTSGNLFCGFFSIISSLKGDFSKAAIALFVAGLFDFLDGRIARMTKTHSRFGEEYDSLADLISFGAAPAVMMYLWALQPYGRLGWLAAFLFLVCGALRLARFNVQAQSIEKRHFQGLPIPIAAGVIASSVLLFVGVFSEGTKNVYMLSITFLLAFLMVSNIQYRSFKDFDLRHTRSFGVLVLVVLMLIVFASHPELTLFVVSTLYVAAGCVIHFFRRYRKMKKRPPEVKS